jgi:glycosyltransferase involved in cell wall biosynthesis
MGFKLVTDKPLTILQVNSSHGRGGAAMAAWNLHRAYQQRAHDAWLAVGYQTTRGNQVFTLPNERYARRGWARFWWRLYAKSLPYYGRYRGIPYRLNQFIHGLADPGSLADNWRGIENFRFPAAWRLLTETSSEPDILHLHNLHQNYFDLRAIPQLSRQVPTFLTLHDMWLLTGHCAHAFDCERWQAGCGRCPDLEIYPSVRRDATAENWTRKRDIFARSTIYVTTASRWLMQKVERSILWPGIVEARVIPYGVDLTIFHPADKEEARARLGLPAGTQIVLFAANGIRRSPWKDFRMMRNAIAQVAERLSAQPILFIALGEDGPSERIANATIDFVPYKDDREIVASYYQAADVYLHASRADVLPLVVMEALACGVPIVATSVGGIPEEVISLGTDTAANSKATGILTPPGDAAAMAEAVERLLENPALLRRLGQNAEQDARQRFDLQRQVNEYLDWYEEILVHRKVEQIDAHE